MKFQVYKKPCKNCLFSEDRIVPESRAKNLVAECIQDNTYFICHVSSSEGGEVCCYGFWQRYRNKVTLLKASEYFEQVEFIPVPDSIKRIPYRDQIRS